MLSGTETCRGKKDQKSSDLVIAKQDILVTRMMLRSYYWSLLVDESGIALSTQSLYGVLGMRQAFFNISR